MMLNSEENQNYYQVLEINQAASHQDIQNAYLKMKNSYATDSIAMYSLLSNDQCEQILGRIEEAYAVLGNPEQRKKYDDVRGLGAQLTKKDKPTITKSLIDSIAEASAELKTTSEPNSFQQEAIRGQERPDFTYSDFPSKKAISSETKVNAVSKFALDYLPNDEMEKEISITSQYTGEFLKKIREYKNVSIERLAEMTKISKTYIRNIENDDYAKLPAKVYTRGFVFQYAKCLKLSSELVATSYLQHIKNLKDSGN